MQKEMVNIQSDLKNIIDGVISGDISTSTYDFRDIEHKKKVLSEYIGCGIEDVYYNKQRNVFVIGNSEYNVLFKDEVKVQKVLNIYNEIDCEAFIMYPEAISKIFDISMEEVERRYEISKKPCEEYMTARDVFNNSENKLSMFEFISKSDEYYVDYAFLSCDDSEVKREDLFIYEYIL